MARRIRQLEIGLALPADCRNEFVGRFKRPVDDLALTLRSYGIRFENMVVVQRKRSRKDFNSFLETSFDHWFVGAAKSFPDGVQFEGR